MILVYYIKNNIILNLIISLNKVQSKTHQNKQKTFSCYLFLPLNLLKNLSFTLILFNVNFDLYPFLTKINS